MAHQNENVSKTGVTNFFKIFFTCEKIPPSVLNASPSKTILQSKHSPSELLGIYIEDKILEIADFPKYMNVCMLDDPSKI